VSAIQGPSRHATGAGDTVEPEVREERLRAIEAAVDELISKPIDVCMLTASVYSLIPLLTS
jgi:hypothetical protein